MIAISRRRTVWGVWAISVAALVGALSLVASHGGAVWWLLVWGMPVIGFSGVGLVLCLRLPRNPLGWLFAGVGIDLGIGLACDAYSVRALGLPDGVAAAVAAQLLEPLPLALLPALLLLFPEGRLPSSRWRPVLVLWAAATVAVALTIVVSDSIGTYGTASRTNPLAVGGSLGRAIGASGAIAFFAVLFPVTIAAAVSLVLRFRCAKGDTRQQLKWFGAAAGFLACALLSGPLGLWYVWSGNAWVILWAMALTAVVIATGIAILRYRLYEIDVIIRRTLVYAALIASLALVYLACVYVIDRGLQAVTGQSGTLAASLSTLAVMAMFQPLRARIQSEVDQRFYRRKYDSTKALDAFSSRLRDQIDLAALNDDLIGVVNATVQPRHASLWLRQPSAHSAEREVVSFRPGESV